MHQDVDNNLSGCGPHKIVHQSEIPRDIPVFGVKRFYEFLY